MTGSDERLTKGERTRRALLDVARRRFGDAGFRAVSVTSIADELGLTSAAAYAYFADKQELYDAALDAEAHEWFASATVADAEPRPVAAMFAGLVGRLGGFPLVERTLRAGDADELRRIIDSPASRRVRAAFRGGIEERRADGRVARDADVDLLALGVETITFALLTTVVRTGLTGDPGRAAAVMAVFDAALGPPDPPSPETHPTES